MFKKFLLAIAAMIVTMGFAFADVDANKGDQAALDGIKGIGPAKSKAIIEERTKGGNFKDWADFEKRVKGIGEKSAVKLSAAGLTVNGQPKAGVEAKPAEKPAKPAKADKAEKVASASAAASMPASASAAASTAKASAKASASK